AHLGPVTLTTDESISGFVANLNPEGVPQWVQYVPNVTIYDMVVDGDSNVILCGGFFGTAAFGKFTLESAGNSDAFIAKLCASSPPIFKLGASTGGGGRIDVSPARPNYLSNTVVTLSAAPEPSWTFLSWLGDTTSTNGVTEVRVNRDVC